jgi:hypothetical protein
MFDEVYEDFSKRGPSFIYRPVEKRQWYNAYEEAKKNGYKKPYEVFKKERQTRHRDAKPLD